MAHSNWIRSRLGISSIELIEARHSTKNQKPSLTPLPRLPSPQTRSTSMKSRRSGFERWPRYPLLHSMHETLLIFDQRLDAFEDDFVVDVPVTEDAGFELNCFDRVRLVDVSLR